MTDILVRGLSPQTVAHIDAQAASLGISRNEFLRRQLDSAAATDPTATITQADLRRASRAADDLDDADVMSAAWR